MFFVLCEVKVEWGSVSPMAACSGDLKKLQLITEKMQFIPQELSGWCIGA
jgi:hypothetical protein